ncbi:21926_t:CDS:1, partial [Dentiscutata erythropus]
DSSILISEVWYYFQKTFNESGLEVYQLYQLIEIPLIQRSDAEKNAEKSYQIINKLFKRTKDQYYQLIEKNIDEAMKFREVIRT